MATNSITKLVTDSQLTQLECACDRQFKNLSEEEERLILAVVSDFILSAEVNIPVSPKKTDRIKISPTVVYGDFQGHSIQQ